MSTVNHHYRWPSIKQEQELMKEFHPVYFNENRELQYLLPCYRITKMLDGFKIWQFNLLMQNWLGNQNDHIQLFLRNVKQILQSNPNAQIIGTINLRNEQLSKVDLVTRSIVNNILVPQGIALSHRYGVTGGEQVEILSEVNARAKQLMDLMPKELTLQNAPTICVESSKIFQKEKQKLLIECGYVKKQERIVLSQEDRAFLGLKPNQATPYLDQLDCTGYALLIRRENNAIPWIKSLITTQIISEDKRKFYEKNPFELLQEWGYRMVDSPDEGDLIVYLNYEPDAGEPKVSHTGTFQSNGTVLSKLSMQDPEIWQHDLNKITAHYGNLVVFFRKSNAII